MKKIVLCTFCALMSWPIAGHAQENTKQSNVSQTKQTDTKPVCRADNYNNTSQARTSESPCRNGKSIDVELTRSVARQTTKETSGQGGSKSSNGRSSSSKGTSTSSSGNGASKCSTCTDKAKALENARKK